MNGPTARQAKVGLSAYMKNLCLLCACLAMTDGLVHAQVDWDERYGPTPSGALRVAEIHAARSARHKEDAHVLVLPGLIADRERKRVELLAEGTGIASHDTVEFLLVDQSSSHGYEALLWSYAKPSDVHKALEFVGLETGQFYDPQELRFWPQGERVVLTVVDIEGGSNAVPVRIEKLLLDRTTESTVAEDGFVFSGSMSARDPKGASHLVYAADVYEPKAIASMFNTPVTVLDVPRQALQGEVYGQYTANPEHAPPGGKLLTIVIEPQPRDSGRRDRRLALDVGPPATNAVAAAASSLARGDLRRLNVLLRDEQGAPINPEPGLLPALESLASIVEREGVTHLVVRFDGALPVESVMKTCLALGVMESHVGVRIAPPEDGQLYYKAFVPDARWRDAENRPSHPWEVWLRHRDGNISGRLVLQEPVWTDEAASPTMKRTSLEACTPRALREALDRDARRREKESVAPLPGVLLIHTAPEITYGELLEFISPVMSTHGTVYVFLSEG